MKARTRWLGAALGVALEGCSLAFPVPDAKVDDVAPDASLGGRASDGGGADVMTDAGALACAQTGRGPVLVAAGSRACVDATPVTRDQYRAFLDAGVALSSQIAGCEGNASWAPLGPLDDGDVLVDGTDWCDAWGFCAWAGKTLCGGFPGMDTAGDGPQPDGGFTHGIDHAGFADRDASVAAWACEGGDAAQKYPYGNDLERTRCVQLGQVVPVPPPLGPVGSTDCPGGFAGLVDMVGIPWWIDSCSGPDCVTAGVDECRLYSDTAAVLDPVTYAQYDMRVAFRCCGLEPPASP